MSSTAREVLRVTSYPWWLMYFFPPPPPLEHGPGRHYSRNPLQIARELHIIPSVEQPPHSIRNRPADFHHQPTPRLERPPGLRNQTRDHFKSSRSSKYRRSRLELAY